MDGEYCPGSDDHLPPIVQKKHNGWGTQPDCLKCDDLKAGDKTKVFHIQSGHIEA